MRPTGLDRHSTSHYPLTLGEGVQDADAVARTHESRNFLVLTLYQIVVRTGWIFKTESVIMPAVLDAMGGAAWLRGCLPLLNRFGQSVPPLFFARRLRLIRRKKWSVAACSVGMAAALLAMAAVWLLAGADARAWVPPVFLAVYGLFFVATGMNVLSFGTLQGKLIRPTLRGRLLTSSTAIGAAAAILAAWLLLRRWLSSSEGAFHLIFGTSGVCFAASALIVLLAAEPEDRYEPEAGGFREHFAGAWKLLRQDANFRRLAIVAMLFGTSMALFPHYQALGRERLGLTLNNLVLWVTVQSAGAALFSLMAGPLADRRGNRLILRVVMLGVACLPPTAIALSHAGRAGGTLFPVVFLMLGLTPIVFKTLTNYTLEISQPADYPRYLSVLRLALAVPMLGSPLVGLLIDRIGFDAVFAGVAAVLAAGWLLTFTLTEPRYRPVPTDAGIPAEE